VQDPGERILRAFEEMTGARQTTCPWQAMRDPFVVAVLDEHRLMSMSKGVASVAHLGELPRPIVDGLRTYDAILNLVLAHDIRAEAEERDRKAKARGVPGHFGRRR